MERAQRLQQLKMGGLNHLSPLEGDDARFSPAGRALFGFWISARLLELRGQLRMEARP
ncbi:hypothetical protein KJ940_10035 [Myxococcota bacterium]|nr:hypothetical protein [Myxococcota bacterium]